MKARREEFYRQAAAANGSQLTLTLPTIIEDDARDLFADIDADESASKRQRVE
jgi:hypothetical protein